MASTSSTHQLIQQPLSCVSSSKLAKVLVFFPFPRPPWPPRHIKISHGPEPTAPNPVGSPQRHNSRQPSLANQAKLASMSETLRIGVTPRTIIVLLLTNREMSRCESRASTGFGHRPTERLKLAARSFCGNLLFVESSGRPRSLSASR